jgi:hypothetical protein
MIEQSMTYIRERLAQGNSLSRMALDTLPLTEGRCLLLSESVDERADLAQGGDIAQGSAPGPESDYSARCPDGAWR